MNTRFTKWIKGKTALTLLALCLISTPFTEKIEVQKAEAQFGGLSPGVTVRDIGNTIQNTIQTLSTVALEQKELVLDGIFRDIAQRALQQMTGDILTYLNSGLDGNPAFVTDVLQYLQDITDEAASDFIYGGELSTLCTPFQLDVRIALAARFQEDNKSGFKKKAECTIDNPGVDVGAFLSGEFNAGGWSVWFETVLNPENTAIGALAAGTVAMNNDAAAKRYAAEKEADWGQGILSKKSCVTVGAGNLAREVCTITTPGALIKDQGSKALGSGIDALLNADEMNEVIGALFGNLAKEAITGVNGMLGLGGNSSYSVNSFGISGNMSYLDAVRQESAQQRPNQVGGNRIQQALITETKVLELELEIIEEVDAITTLFEETREPYENNSCWNLALPEELGDTLDELLVTVPSTVSTVVTLQDLAAKYASTTSASGQLGLLQQFSALQSEGLIQGQTALIEYDFYLKTELKDLIDTLTEAIEDEENVCS